jgi:hypothetical protein
MSAAEIVVHGAVTADGQLILDERPSLLPGRVEVTLRSLENTATERHPMFETLRRIWAEQDARGFRGRSGEEIVADVRAMRDEWEPRQRAIERLQERLQATRAEREGEAEQP